MYDFTAFLLLFFWLSVSGTVAAPTPLNGAVVTSGLTSVHIRSFNAVVVSSSFNHTLRYPRGLSNSTDQFLPIPSMPFPKYGIVLLALFIVICAICCVLVLFILYSHTMQRWIRGIPGHICALFKGGKCDGGRVSTEDQVPNRDGDKEKNDTVLHILSSAGDVSFPCDDHLGGHSNKSANSSEETVSTPTNPPAPFSVVASPPSGSHPSYISTRSPSIHAARSPQISPTSHSRSPSSPLFERLQTLLATSRMMFRTLTADRSSRPSTPSPKALTTVDIPTPTRTETGFIHSISLPIVNMHSDDAAKTVAGNRGCPQTSESFMPSPAANLMSTKRTCVPQSDYSTTPSSMSINSRSGFYSLSGDAQLSPSTAFHSLIDLPTLATPSDTPPATILKSSLPSSSCNREQLGSPLSPRYVHGAQLETIHEENDTQTSHLKQAFPDYSHESCNILMFTSPSAPLLDDTPSRDSLTVCPQEAKPNQSERTIRALPLKPTSKPHAYTCNMV
ncbi:hypothetical protein K439DRAFT_765464 [Ramaria rubella]|nr:hypothetical protein K439DRAFT_765464 [Ramaria rubella]